MHKLTVTGIENCQRRENLEKQWKGRVGKQGQPPCKYPWHTEGKAEYQYEWCYLVGRT